MFWETLAEPWQGCLAEAWTAYCAGSLPIGAVVTEADGSAYGVGIVIGGLRRRSVVTEGTGLEMGVGIKVAL